MAPATRLAGRSLASLSRSFHGGRRALLPYKDSQDRDSLRPRSAENTKSGRDDDASGRTDDDASGRTDVAFDGGKTDPESARAQGDGKPLNASGANQELSKPRGDERSGRDAGAGVETNKGGASGNSQKQGRPGKV
ncbi:hypothetical protein HIM_11118 [Hirsutella minnesotensis 3608]|uniref:Uncharacterized protein n=1 Tax=Hirsutella minnesotensis 3608 TaxID=1043627 RepID=A0A0F8A1K1_9HYPO|nr:hypothetical protein HIM_11118 [Hirsutella minnesotensis 3608]